MKYILLLVLMGTFAYSILDYLKTPDVYKSWSTKKCVVVIDYKGNKHSCDMLRDLKQYNLVWVE